MGKMLFLASGSNAAASSGSGSSSFLLILIVGFGLLMFWMYRSQRNRQRQAQQMQRDVTPGQRVRTTAGMYATVVALDGDDVVLEVAPGVEVRYLRRAIVEVVPDGSGFAAAGPDDADEDAAEADTDGESTGEPEAAASEVDGTQNGKAAD